MPSLLPRLLVDATTAPKVAGGDKVVPTTEVGVADGAIVPSTSSSPLAKIQVLELLMGGEQKEKRKEKKKSVTIKVQCKAHPSKSDDGDEDLEENFFCNQDIIRDLVDKFALPEVVDKITNFDYE
ncbi:hypothetical protein COCNU_scaffold000192G000040 [Cocos nucifera]|nr:hypothetical protein [Cocos nucifera]